MNLFTLKPHPFSQMFPGDITSDGFWGLVSSIKKIGRNRNAVIVYDNHILDGNRRVRACEIANVPNPKWIEFKGTEAEALEVVWDLNYNRRDLTPSLRAVAFAQYCKFADLGRPDLSGPGTTLNEAAEKARVGKRTMQRAKKVVEHGTEEQLEDIKKGKTTVKAEAAKIAKGHDLVQSCDAVDSIGIPIPEVAKQFWDRRVEVKSVLSAISGLRKRINMMSSDDPMWAEVNLNGVLADVSNAYNRFKAAYPEYVCPYCQGVHPAKCTVCKGRGVISKHMWKVAIPEEIRAMQEKRGTTWEDTTRAQNRNGKASEKSA